LAEHIVVAGIAEKTGFLTALACASVGGAHAVSGIVLAASALSLSQPSALHTVEPQYAISTDAGSVPPDTTFTSRKISRRALK
jgi:hypothetical protein